MYGVHTVSFDWFLSSLEWLLNLHFCLLKLLIFYQKLLWNIRSRHNSSTRIDKEGLTERAIILCKLNTKCETEMSINNRWRCLTNFILTIEIFNLWQTVWISMTMDIVFSLVTVLQSRNVQKSVFPSISKFIISRKQKSRLLKRL